MPVFPRNQTKFKEVKCPKENWSYTYPIVRRQSDASLTILRIFYNEPRILHYLQS